MIYKKLKRTWSNNNANYIPRFKEVFPELSKLTSEDLCDRFVDLNVNFYTQQEKKVKFINRLTMPFALMLLLLMFIFIPVNFIITGNWGYSISKSNPKLLNWFRSLNLQ